MRLVSTVRAARRVPLIQVIKAALAVVAGWLVASAVFPERYPVFAAIAALLVVQPSVTQSFGKAIERSFGVIVGVLVATGIAWVFGDFGWVVMLATVVAVMVGWALRLTPGTANQVPISAMLVLSIGLQTPGYALERIVETVIGAAIAVVINVAIVPPVVLRPAHQAVRRLADAIAASIDDIAGSLSAPQTPESLRELLVTTRLLRSMQQNAQDALLEGKESLTLNPRKSKHRTVLDADAALYRRLAPLVTRVLGMARALHDHYNDSLREEPSVQAVATELQRAAHDLRRLVRHTVPQGQASPPTTSVPALTAPLSLETPHPDHWVLLGALMEDMRRIREQIVDD